ncbi:MAG: carbohydrate binding family 9 domain-containing protein [Draconibacterium sp.]|nr:carbohydrate binding family 9 domain-containing protein [Draconibacterium sp.]
MRHLFLLLLFSALIATASANPFKKSKNDTIVNTFNKDFVYMVKKAKSAINIDGVIDEQDWKDAQKADEFYKVLPIDTGFASQPSLILMTYDDKALYLAQVFYDSIPGKRIMESYRRDFNFGANDNLLVFFDTFLDQTNGFSFGVSASGAKWDGLMHDGSRISLDWDCKWESKTKHYDDRWVTEMRSPFKSIRYPKGSQRWNTNFSRLDLKANEKSAWAPVPRQFPTASLAYTGVMRFEEPLPKSKTQFSVIPYIFGSYANDFEAKLTLRL